MEIFKGLEYYFHPKSKEWAKTGSKYFAKASAKCPASITAQGAVIAQLATESEDHLDKLKNAVLFSRKDLRKLQNAAVEAHIHHNNGPVTKKELPLKFMKKIISNDFEIAKVFSVLPNSELYYISETIFDECKGEEDAIRQVVRNRNPQLNWSQAKFFYPDLIL